MYEVISENVHPEKYTDDDITSLVTLSARYTAPPLSNVMTDLNNEFVIVMLAPVLAKAIPP